MAKWLFLLATLIGLGAFAYRTGSILAEREVVQLRGDLAARTRTVDELRHENATLKSIAERAQRAEAEWRRRYEQDVPTGIRKELLALIEQQMKAKVKPDRLRFLIRAASAGEKCSGSPDTKRFLVKTPVSPNIDASVGAVAFAEGSIVVTAEGDAATTPDGKPQAVFDPTKPVTVQFSRLGGKRTQVSGPLPLFHSLVAQGSEYRFGVVAGERRGFLHVTAERCSFP